MENYQKIIQAFIDGEVDGVDEIGTKPTHIETQISHVFLFPATVYKICKRDNTFFNEHFRDLSEKESRFAFYEEDFSVNNYFSPDVYLGLYGVSVVNDKVQLNKEVAGAEDIVMKMKKINLSNNFSKLLHEKTLTLDDFFTIGFQQTKEVASYPNQPKTDESYYEFFRKKLNDVRDWMYSAPDYFSRDEVDEIIKEMQVFLEREKASFENISSDKYVITIDNHSDNIFYENGKILFLDIYPPKKDWLIASPLINIYRPATDIFILAGEECARSFINGCKEYYSEMDESHEPFYFIYSAAIQGVSLHNLSQSNEIKKQDSILYKNFILKNIEKLKQAK